MSESLIAKIQAVVEPILDDLQFELVDIEYLREQTGMVLRLYIDKEGGVTLDDCIMASREVGPLLEVEDVIRAAYNLEVSSPGLERPLKKLSDFKRFSGDLAKIKTFEPCDPDNSGTSRKTFIGVLSGCREEDVLLILTGQVETVAIPLVDIEKARLQYEF